MKRKVKVKSLPKAQYGFNNLPAPKVLRPDYLETWQKNNPYPAFGNPSIISADVYAGNPNTTGSFNISMPGFERNTSPSFYADVYQGDPNTTGPFNLEMPFFSPITPSAPSTVPMKPKQGSYDYGFGINSPGFLNTFGQGDNIITGAPLGTRRAKDEKGRDISVAPGYTTPSDKQVEKQGNPYIGPMLLAGTDVVSSTAKKIQDRNARSNYRNEFLSDNLYNVRPEDYQSNRGDYNFNEYGFGPSFRPDDYIYGDYNKIAQMGGEMKRKVKITSLPQAAYGGSQNSKAVNQLYGNSAYIMNMFNGATKGEPEEQYNQTLGPDPRSMAVLEAEKGETLIRKGTSSAIPEFFKIGGKRHSEGGTPLSGEKATPDSFIYSDTKAMKIKDPAILESFGFKAKKGGHTPAKISKKFDLNNKDLREGLYSENDPLRKKTAVLMTDNHISNLGKLALVQESQKGFPQGIPQIAMPYMDKVGLDPSQFLPPSPEEGMAMAMYGGIYKAQIGGSVYSNSSNQTLSDGKGFWETGSFANTTPEQRAAFARQSNPYNPLNWSGNLNYMFTGDPSYNVLTDPLNYLAVGKLAKPAARIAAKALEPIGGGISKVLNPVKNWYKNLDVSGPITAALDVAPAATVLGAAAYRALSPEEKVEYLKTATPEEVNEIVADSFENANPADTALLMEEAKNNPNVDVARIPEVTIKAKAKSAPTTESTQVDDAFLDSLINAKRQDMINKKEYGGELKKYQTAGQVTGEREYVEEIPLPNGTRVKRITKGNTISIVDASGKVLKSETIEPNYRTINPARLAELEKAGIKLTVPKRYEGKEWGMTPGKQGTRDGSGTYGTEDWYANENRDDFAKRQSRFLRFYPEFNPKNKNDVKVYMTWYNSDIYDQGIKAGLSEEEAQKNVKEFGFDPNSKDPNALDSMFGHYAWSRPTIDINRKPPGTPREEIPPGELNIPPTPRRPIGFYPQDVLNTAAAVGDLASINKYNPRMVQFNAEPMEPTYYDPNRELANNAEMVNMAAQQLAQFTGPQAFNSRFSDVQGKGLANAANIESKYNNLNVGVANQFEQANKQLINEANFRNQLAANDFYDKSVVANQQYDNARRQGRRQSVDYINAALENRFITDQMNSLYPNFYVEPSRLKTYYTPGRQITPQQKGNDMMSYLKATNIPFDFTDPGVQAALLKGIMGDVNVDERGNIAAAQAAMNAKRRGK
jgi:hypothetical protein